MQIGRTASKKRSPSIKAAVIEHLIESQPPSSVLARPEIPHRLRS
jgi:hypothetical protein